jgi:hypothetical protein
VLDELVAAAAAQYWESSKARVTVHLAENVSQAMITDSIKSYHKSCSMGTGALF